MIFSTILYINTLYYSEYDIRFFTGKSGGGRIEGVGGSA